VGIAFPRNGTTYGYSAQDTVFQTDLPQLQQQTHVTWVEMTVRLFQDGRTSTTVIHGFGTTSPEALAAGITHAHSLGLKVYVEPLLTVLNAPDDWGDGRLRQCSAGTSMVQELLGDVPALCPSSRTGTCRSACYQN
jgi:hypothetical protein